MRFKGIISHEGMRALEQFLPCLEKFGKHCYLLLTPTDVYLLQDVDTTDGMQVSARLENVRLFAHTNKNILKSDLITIENTSNFSFFSFSSTQNIIFEPNTCVIQSRNDNYIAFTISIPLFLKALRAADGYQADTLSVKLTTRSAPGTDPTQQRNRPMLIFSWQGDDVGLGQELPVGKPLQTEAELLIVRRLCNVTTMCPFYLDICPELRRITLCADKLKPLGASAVRLSLAKQGDLHLTIEGSGLTLGEGFPGLEALWEHSSGGNNDGGTNDGDDSSSQPVALTSENMEDRLREAQALQDGSVTTALVEIEHLVKALHSAPPTMPQRLLCGIRSVEENINVDTGGAGSFVHFMFVYEQGVDENGQFPMHLFFKLPIKEES